MAEDSLYDVLGVEKTATKEKIEVEFRRLVKQSHPDVGGNDYLFRQVRRAYETLSDPDKRAAYDASLNGTSSTGTDDYASDSGWRRADEPHGWEPPKSPPPRQPPPGPGPGPDGWDEPHPPGGPSTDVPWQRPTAESGVLLLRKNPWVIVVVVAIVIGAFNGTLGAILFLFGAVAALGSRRAIRKRVFARSGYVSIDSMDGVTFEHYVESVLRASGYRVRHVGRTGDFGADLTVERDGVRSVVQAKRWTGNVGVSAVQEVAAARAHYDAQRAIVLTSSFFTDAAVRLAQSNHVELWDRNRLADMVHNLRDFEPAPFSLFFGEFAAGFGMIFKFFRMIFVGILAASAATSRSTRRRR